MSIYVAKIKTPAEVRKELAQARDVWLSEGPSQRSYNLTARAVHDMAMQDGTSLLTESVKSCPNSLGIVWENWMLAVFQTEIKNAGDDIVVITK